MAEAEFAEEAANKISGSGSMDQDNDNSDAPDEDLDLDEELALPQVLRDLGVGEKRELMRFKGKHTEVRTTTNSFSGGNDSITMIWPFLALCCSHLHLSILDIFFLSVFARVQPTERMGGGAAATHRPALPKNRYGAVEAHAEHCLRRRQARR